MYQRKYDWKEDNCRQLYEDLKKIVRDNRQSHFFGSIVASVIGNGASTEYHIIDGQQRLTTVSLLLLAIRNLIRQKKITAQADRLDDQINDRFLVSPWAKAEDKIKLRPVKSDREALAKLYGDEEDFDLANTDRSIVAECKCYTWTDSGNVPSAKLMGLDEAVFYFGFLPPDTKKLLCMKKAVYHGKSETLAEYYVRVHGHLLKDVYVYEIADDGCIREIRNGIAG